MSGSTGHCICCRRVGPSNGQPKERRLVELIVGLSKYPDIKMELVLTKKDIFYTKIYQTGIKVHFLDKTGIKKDPRIFYHFFKISRKFKPDLIHVWGNMAALLAIPTHVQQHCRFCGHL